MDVRKRKRDSEKHGSPKKRVAIAPPSGQEVLKVSFLPSVGGLEPVLGKNGLPQRAMNKKYWLIFC
jgi:hypothetical protein